VVGAQTWRRRGGLTENGAVRGPESSPLQHDVKQPADHVGDPPTTRGVWEGIYGRPLSDADLADIEGNLFRFIDLLASISGSILGARELSTTDGDEAA
jgi:hypothetical protein